MAKKNQGKYRLVDQLPDNAMTVTEYAAQTGLQPTAIYKRIERKTANFEIVIFKTMNFVLPLTNN